MKQFLSILFCSLTGWAATAQQKTVERPRLVVGMVVDQMRWDYLYRFYDRYQPGGFRRLMNEGFNCEQTLINYIPTYTAPGHACVYTGSVPSIHGITGNDWIDNFSGRLCYCTEDSTAQPVGGSRRAGMMSPSNLLTTTITDELRLATNFRSRVFGIAMKDRGAILPAGHLGNGAYWFDDSTGGFMSSSYYGASLPGWLQAFNGRRLTDSFLKQGWNTLYPPASYSASIADDNPYEGRFSGEQRPVFPHVLKASGSFSGLRRIPAGNTFTLEAAKACIDGEALGSRGTTDFLCVSLSSTDYIGHQFAPNSMEVEDTYLRLDKDLAVFLAYLDQRVGKGNYLFFLTADHGGAHNAAYLRDLRIPGGNESEPKMAQQLSAWLKQEYGRDSLVRDIVNYQVVLNEPVITSAGLDRTGLKRRIMDWFYRQPQVAYVMDMEQPYQAALPEQLREMAINGYNRHNSGSLLVINNPGWYYGYAPTGTTHGTWHPYDSHIPLLWYGWKTPKGSTGRTVHMEDIAPTIGALLHVQMPNGNVGKVITELVK